jgi:hypothetical protein
MAILGHLGIRARKFLATFDAREMFHVERQRALERRPR